MSDFQHMTIVGRIVKDPEANTKGDSTTQFAKFTVATSKGRKIDGEWKNESLFVNVVIFGRAAEYVLEHRRKGDTVLVEGEPDITAYLKDGAARPSVSLKANRVVLLRDGNARDDGKAPF